MFAVGKFFFTIIVTVPTKSNETGGRNLERKCGTASSVPQQIAHFSSKLRVHHSGTVTIILFGNFSRINFFFKSAKK